MAGDALISPNERTPLILGYLCIVLAVLGVVGIFVTSAGTAAVCVFAVGVAGVVASTAALVQAENAVQRPASRTV